MAGLCFESAPKLNFSENQFLTWINKWDVDLVDEAKSVITEIDYRCVEIRAINKKTNFLDHVWMALHISLETENGHMKK